MSDLIDRQAAIDALESCEPGEERFMITSLPSAQPEPKCANGCIYGWGSTECEHCALKSAQPEQQWIPCSEPPKESGTYIVTAYDGTDKRVTFVKYQKTLKRWDLTGARAYWRILAYKSLPEPWRGEEHGQDD